ncbi:MAG TPA: ABC transporter permease [Thermoleophilaceae bacterium]|jgi:ABC-2 type transport system permease protein|nr:ABC transporter permease [Thermoleophilaceae bacterium]
MATPATAVEPGRRPIKGPSALGDDPRRALYLSVALAVTDFKLRFFGSILGYFWQLVRPLLLFGVLYLVFTHFVRIGAGVEFYPVLLLENIVLYTFFAEGTGAVTSLVDREGLVRKVQFPLLAIPVAAVLLAGFNMVLNGLAVLVFALASGVEVRASWLEMPLLLLALGTFVLGLAMLLSALYVRFRDVKPIWEVVLQLFFYGTPIIYAIETIGISDHLKELIMLNPLAAIIQQARHAVLDPSAPSAAEAVGGAARLLIPAGIVIGLFALGLWFFNREAPIVAEEL